MEATTQDVTLGGNRYQLTRFSARDGSWIVGQFLTRNLLLSLEDPEKEISEKDLGLGLAAVFQSFPEATYNTIQGKCLAAVRRYEDAGGQPVARPVLMADGRWALAGEPNAVELLAITVATLVFNLHCFFAPGALEMLQTVFPDLSGSPSAPGSTATSSAPSPQATGTTAIPIR